MFSKFGERLADILAGTWDFRALARALVFAVGGLLAYVYAHGSSELIKFLDELKSLTGKTVAIAVAIILGLLVASTLMTWIVLPAIRWFEGYWPAFLSGLRSRWTDSHDKRYNQMLATWLELAPKFRQGQLQKPLEREEFARLGDELARYPLDPALRLPTRLGNILRAAEEYPLRSYGLEINLFWPRLWLLMPPGAQKELEDSYRALCERMQTLLWSVLFLVFTGWAWWAVPLVSAFVIGCAYRNLLSAASRYGDLLCASFDLYRFAVYRQLRWPLPETPAEEYACGRALTDYLRSQVFSKKARFGPCTEKA